MAPHDHIDGERPRTSDSESTKPIGRRAIRCLLIKSNTIVIDNNGHSASIVRRALRYMRQSKDHFAHKRQFFGARNTLCNQHEAELTLGSADVFSADQVAVHQPAVEFAAPESVAANLSILPAPRHR